MTRHVYTVLGFTPWPQVFTEEEDALKMVALNSEKYRMEEVIVWNSYEDFRTYDGTF